MRDGDIRKKLDAHLRWYHADDPDTLIRHEMGLCGGERRIDVALLNGEISGFEIKSDEDTLFRLFGQADAYRKVLDRVTLVTTSRHKEKAISVLPLWWGVMVARQEQGSVILEPERAPDINTGLDPFALAQLLWRGEALDELKSRGLSKGLSKKARHYVWLALAQSVAIDELRDLVRERIKARTEWLADQRYAQSGATPPTAATE